MRPVKETTRAMPLKKTRTLTFDTVTGKEVRPGMSESFDGRFMTAKCVWNGEEWVPIDDKRETL